MYASDALTRKAAGIYLHRVDDTSSLLESLQQTSEGSHWRVAEVLSEAPLGSYWGLAGVSLGARWGLAGGSPVSLSLPNLPLAVLMGVLHPSTWLPLLELLLPRTCTAAVHR